MKNMIFLFAILFLAFSCKNSSTQSNAQRDESSIISDSVQMKSAQGLTKKDQNNMGETNNEIQEDQKKILGSWQNDDDAKDILTFQKDIYISTYEHTKDTFKFAFSKTSCDEADNQNSQSQSIYLSAKNSRNVSLCYEVTKLDSNGLALMFLSNGNILTYHRIK